MSSIPTSFAPVMCSASNKVVAPGMSLMINTNPNAIVFNGTTYLFFTGSGGNGIWSTSTDDEGSWQNAVQISTPNQNLLGISSASNPCTVVVPGSPDRLFLFYTGGGANGIFYTSILPDGNWTNTTNLITSSSPAGLGINMSTSPSIVELDGALYLYYDGNGNNGIYSVISGNGGGTWGDNFSVTVGPSPGFQPALNILMGTSPSAVVFQDTIYLFYTAGGSASGVIIGEQGDPGTPNANSIWFTTSSNGTSWSSPASPLPASSSPAGMEVLVGTSPAAVVAGDALYLFWLSPAGLQGTVSMDGQTWQPAITLSNANPNSGTSVAASEVNNVPTLFWSYGQTVLSSSLVPTYCLETTPLSQFMNLLEQGQDLLIAVKDPDAQQALQSMLSPTTSPQPVTAEMLDGRYLTLAGNSTSIQPLEDSPLTALTLYTATIFLIIVGGICVFAAGVFVFVAGAFIILALFYSA